MTTNIGTEDQWRKIFERKPGLQRVLNALIDLTAQDRPVALQGSADELVYSLSRVCIEECWEILLLAANEYPKGASKLLRGLYERALTLSYINKFPEKTERFYKYGAIQRHRTLCHARRVLSEDALNEAVAPMTVGQLDSEFVAAKPDFKKTKCKVCKSTELAHSWDIDVASMADKVGNPFPDLLLMAYVQPTLELHTTFDSAFSRTKSTQGGLTFSFVPSPDEIDSCILHGLVLIHLVWTVLIERFHLPLHSEVASFGEALYAGASTETS
jgi:hypothetical protein